MQTLENESAKILVEKDNLKAKLDTLETAANSKATESDQVLKQIMALENEKQTLENTLSELRTKSTDSNAQVDTINSELIHKRMKLKIWDSS